MKRARESGLDIVLDPSRAEASLWRRARFEDDRGSRETLFNRYVVLARSIAARHFRRRRGPAADRADAEHFAYEGLLDALDRYDPLTGVPFGAYARPRISGSVADGLSHLTDVDAQIGQRRRLRQERLRSLAPAGGRPADPLAALADLAVELAIGLMLEGTGMVESPGGVDTRPNAYEGLAWTQTQVALADAIERLPDAEGTVIRQHYQTGLSFAQIAELLRLSRSRISQLHKSAVDRLRRRLRHHERN